MRLICNQLLTLVVPFISNISARFDLDNWNKIKNVCSKVIGGKMMKKEPVGDSDELPADVVEGLASSTADKLEVSLVK